MKPHCRRTLPLLALLAMPLLGQEGKVDPKGEGGPPPVKSAAGEKEITAEGQVADSAGTDFAVAGKSEAGLASFMAPVMSTRPYRLAPGESGTFVVVMSLQGSAVVAPNAPLSVTYETTQGSVQLGNWAVLPAKPNTLYPRFKDQLLHEKYLQLEIPIVIDPSAKLEKHPVKFAVEVEVSDGNSGRVISRGKGDFQYDVLVGKAVPRPAPIQINGDAVQSSTVQSGRGTSQPERTPASTTAKPANGEAVVGRQDLGGAAARPPGEGRNGTTRTELPPLDAPHVQDDKLWIYLAAGLAGVGLIAAFLIRKR